ncbi:hypothetical protein [Sporosarcina sp. G11-34]|uniref:hypothetical protein n=1 Tax=Sporosarcina sp. G11-34 TaxID=2849605 RepID=UPI0022A9CD16|nr:hypothetical protein [Sporosarcina sp. G11-34]
MLIYEVANEWGIHGKVLEKSVDVNSITSPEDIPFIDDLTSSLDFSSATKKQGVNKFMHDFTLTPYFTKNCSAD